MREYLEIEQPYLPQLIDGSATIPSTITARIFREDEEGQKLLVRKLTYRLEPEDTFVHPDRGPA